MNKQDALEIFRNMEPDDRLPEVANQNKMSLNFIQGYFTDDEHLFYFPEWLENRPNAAPWESYFDPGVVVSTEYYTNTNGDRFAMIGVKP